MELINEKDAALYIDVYCYECKRLVTLSNTYEVDGRRLCWICADKYLPIIEFKRI